jgi:hypothetical protein
MLAAHSNPNSIPATGRTAAVATSVAAVAFVHHFGDAIGAWTVPAGLADIAPIPRKKQRVNRFRNPPAIPQSG